MSSYLKSIDLPIVGQILEKTQGVQAFMDKSRVVGTMIDFAKNTKSIKTPFLYMAKDGAKGVLELDFNIDTAGVYTEGQIVNVVTEGVVCLEVDATLNTAEYGSVVYWDSTANKVTATETSNTKIGSVASSVFKAQKIGVDGVTDAIFVKIQNGLGA